MWGTLAKSSCISQSFTYFCVKAAMYCVSVEILVFLMLVLLSVWTFGDNSCIQPLCWINVQFWNPYNYIVIANAAVKELSDEIQRLQQHDREGSGFHASTDKGESRQIITVGDSLPDALDGSTIANKKRRRQSLPSIQDAVTLSPREELPTGTAQPSTSSYRYTEVSTTLQFLSHMLVYVVELSWDFTVLTIWQYFSACLL